MTNKQEYDFNATVWEWEGKGAWYFLTVPRDESDDIDFAAMGMKGGWGSVRVTVTIGNTTWCTSVFPDGKRNAYILPVKAAVRKAEGIDAGSEVSVHLALGAPDAPKKKR
ncbi:MAG TPA: DUF1905 domain-containing protein [Capsulimonadaceae bacterium]